MKTIYKVNGKKIKVTPKGRLAEKYNLSEAEKNQLRIMYLDRLEKEIEKSYDKARKLGEKIDFIGISIGIPKEFSQQLGGLISMIQTTESYIF